jgi:[acyl-carrier-protein] S-malonyltransferase
MKKIAFIFPGQGSQTVGMGKDFFDNSDIAKEMIDNASKRIDVDFKKLLFEANDDLEKTQFTQPAILLVSAIATKLLQEKIDIKPEFLLGHSLGEFSALVASGALDYVDAVELVHKRGAFMNDACKGADAGMMAIIGLDDEVVEKLCEDARNKGKSVWPANYNSKGQVVLAGKKADLEELVSVFKEAGAKRALVLNMSVASHCPMLKVAVENLDPYLDEFVNGEFNAPIISNVTADKYDTKEEAIRVLKQQLTSPVLYKQSISKYAEEVDLIIELGNGKVLQGLNKRGINTPTISVNDMASLEKAIEQINE